MRPLGYDLVHILPIYSIQMSHIRSLTIMQQKVRAIILLFAVYHYHISSQSFFVLLQRNKCYSFNFAEKINNESNSNRINNWFVELV